MMIFEFKGDNEFLSNFYKSPFAFMGIEFPTVEHFYQASKACDFLEAHNLANCPMAGGVKRLGKAVELRGDWEEVKIDVMRLALSIKFSDDDLREKLLATGDCELYEGNTWGDTFWGVDLRTGVGKNHLGKLLTELREKLRRDCG